MARPTAHRTDPVELGPTLGARAGHAFVVTVVAVSVVVLALALWKLRVVLALLLLGITAAAAIRPGVEQLARWRVPRPIGVLLHYAGLTVSWQTAVLAGGCLLAIRLTEDYAVTPRVLGGAVGLPPLLTLISVSVVGILLGGFYVLLSIPIASIVSTVFDVAVRGVDPAEVEAPTVLLPSRETR